MASLTLERVAQRATIFPHELLEGCETGLVLFAGAFMGANDAIHFACAGVETICVDTDAKALEAMRELYPPDWEFIQADAWTYAEAARDLGLTWDAVSVDTWTGDQSRRSMESLELWTSIAERLVVVTMGSADRARVPVGWTWGMQERSDKASWLILERA